MPWQLIYTSAPRTLVAGQSGYGTVARSHDLREALAQRLEQFSYYAHGSAPRQGTSAVRPIVFAYRILDFRGSRYHVLTRVQDAGLDFTNRTNHLAHHLVFEPAELAGLPPPSIILAHWDGWRQAWQEEPRKFSQENWGNLRSLPRCVPLPATTWQLTTGDAGSAAALLGRNCAAGVTMLCRAEHAPNLLSLFAESLQLLDPTGRQPVRLWEHTFTTFFQAEDNPADFRWRACLEGSPAWQAAQRSGEPGLLSLNEVSAPDNALAQLARQGPAKPSPPAKAPKPAPSGPPRPEAPAWLEVPPPEPRPLRGYDPSISGTTVKRPTRRTREISLDLSSPRLWVSALALLLVLALVLGLPKFLKSSKTGGAPLTETLPPPVSPSVSAPSTPETILSDLNPTPDTPAEKPAGPKALAAPTKETLSELAKEIDSVPTWFVPCEKDGPVLLPKIKELEELLNQVFFAEGPLPLSAIDCRITSGRVEFSPAAASTAEVIEQNDPKGLSARIRSGAGFQVDCNGWLADKGSGRPVSFLARNLREAGLLVAKFQSGAEPARFPAFRLVALGGPRFEPLRLSKTLLTGQSGGFAAALHPDLLKWVNNLHIADARATWQLRPSTRDSAGTDLFDNLAEAFRPGQDDALNFDMIRQRINKPLSLDHEKQAKLTKAVDEFQLAMQKDLSLGEILGQTNDLSSLAVYAKKRNHKLDRQTYLDYLHDLIGTLDPRLLPRIPPAEASEDDVRIALGSLRAFLEQSPAVGRQVRRIPAGYFENRWDILGNTSEMVRKGSELDSTRKSIARYEGYLRLVPPELATTPRVSLVLVTATGKRFEIVRFEDPPLESAKGTP